MFSTQFEIVLKEKNISPYKISKMTGISQSTLSDYRLGKVQPTAEKLKLIAESLNVSTDYLLGNVPKSTDPIPDNQLKFALFGDVDIDDDVLEDIRTIAKTFADREAARKAKRMEQ